MADKLILTSLDFNSVSRLKNLPDAVSAQEPATLAQLNSTVQGLKWKNSARVATQSNTNLSAPGSTIDGITMDPGDRVLVPAQTSQPENGLYIWNGAAVAMTRSGDADTAAELEQAIVTVEEGTSAGVSYRQETVNFTLGSGNVVWSSGFGSTVPDASDTVKGKVELATTAETTTGTDAVRAVTPAGLAGSVWAKLKYAADFGDGSATSYAITHNLNTRDVIVKIYRNSGNYDEVEMEVRHNTVNQITILTDTAPTSNQYRVVIVA